MPVSPERGFQSLQLKFIAPPVLCLILFAIFSATFFMRSSEQITHDTAIRNAVFEADHVKELRSFYISSVTSKISRQDTIKIGADYQEKPDTIPYPASFIIDLLDKQSSSEKKLAYVSPYPFREGRKMDSFQTDAWKALQENPSTPFTRREIVNGKEFMRLAVGDHMTESCVACHNTMASSPRKGWKVGDLRGVMEISQSVDSILAAQSQTKSRLMILTLIGTGAVAALLYFISLKSAINPLRKLAAAITSMSAVRTEIKIAGIERRDEIGVIARAIDEFNSVKQSELKLQEQSNEAAAQRERELVEIKNLAQNFDEDVRHMIAVISATSLQLEASSGHILRLSTATEGSVLSGSNSAALLGSMAETTRATSSEIIGTIDKTERIS
jgi:methyl-accepting chemotaxis protein